MCCVKAVDLAIILILVLNCCIYMCMASVEARLVTNEGLTINVSLGRLEWNDNNQGWKPVCEYNFNSATADVTCRQLGFNRASTYGCVGDLGLLQGTGSSLYISHLQCSGTETRLRECDTIEYPSRACGHFQDIGLNCTGTLEFDYGVLLWTGVSALGVIIIIVSTAVLILCCLVVWRGKLFKSKTNARNERPMTITATTYELANEQPPDGRPLLEHQEPYYNEEEEPDYHAYVEPEPGAPSAPMPEQQVPLTYNTT